jgi:hypothetical protein
MLIRFMLIQYGQPGKNSGLLVEAFSTNPRAGRQAVAYFAEKPALILGY